MSRRTVRPTLGSTSPSPYRHHWLRTLSTIATHMPGWVRIPTYVIIYVAASFLFYIATNPWRMQYTIWQLIVLVFLPLPIIRFLFFLVTVALLYFLDKKICSLREKAKAFKTEEIRPVPAIRRRSPSSPRVPRRVSRYYRNNDENLTDFEDDPGDDSLSPPVRRAPHRYEDDPHRQDLSSSINNPPVAHRVSHLEELDEEELDSPITDEDTSILLDTQAGGKEPILQLSGLEPLQCFSSANEIDQIAWSPDGTLIAIALSASKKEVIEIWDTHTWQRTERLSITANYIYSLAWSPDGETLAAVVSLVPYRALSRREVYFWKRQCVLGEEIENSGNEQWVQLARFKISFALAVKMYWSPDGKLIVIDDSSSISSNTWVFQVVNDRVLQIQKGFGNDDPLYRLLQVINTSILSWSPDGEFLATTVYRSGKTYIDVYHTSDYNVHNTVLTLTTSSMVRHLAWSPDNNLLAFNLDNGAIGIFDCLSKRRIARLEGHISNISHLCFSRDGRILISSSRDNRFGFWNTRNWSNIAQVDPLLSMGDDIVLHSTQPLLVHRTRSLLVHRTQPLPSTRPRLVHHTYKISVIEMNTDALLATHNENAVSYINARVVLLGDSGVGKTGLGLVLSGQQYHVTESTHGRYIWNFERSEVDTPDDCREIRETLLWDLAGQPGYRLIHQFYLDEVTIALIVFDGRSETDPFAGIQHWDRALRMAQRIQGEEALPLKKFLVQARSDRGGRAISRERIQALISQFGFDGYFETSAKEGWGITELREAITRAIDWSLLPPVSSNKLFQSIKDFLIHTKEHGCILSTVDELYYSFVSSPKAPTRMEQLQEQFASCIRLLESVGLIKHLSFGNLVLLQPEKLDAYASALINAVRDEPDGLGSITEERVRQGDFLMSQDERLLDEEQEKLLLIAMIEDLLRREIVLREEPYLVFPSQSMREHPSLPNPQGKAITFAFEGPALNVYATLAVRLSYSGLFKKKELWRNAITYSSVANGICGIFLMIPEEGKGEITLFYDQQASQETRLNFEEFVSAHIQRRALPQSVVRRRIFTCRGCGYVLDEQIVHLRRQQHFDWVKCPVCEQQTIKFADYETAPQRITTEKLAEMDTNADIQRDREATRTSVQGKEATNDFDVFLCHNGDDKAAVKQIGEQLKENGLLPWLDEWELPPGKPWQDLLEEQIEHVKSAAVFVGSSGIGPWQNREMRAFLNQFVQRGCPVIPVLLPGAPEKPALPRFLQDFTWVDFCSQEPEPLPRLIWGITGKKPETIAKLLDA